MKISEIILDWYKKNRRPLPWRETKDPYSIWLSEIILQQTRVQQGLDYYLKFMERFPNVHSLASASEQKVIKLWQGLGYYSRARNLLVAARQITGEYNGNFPDTYEEIIKLKGVGPYTAAAIASIAFHQPVPVVDGNVARVISRLFGITEPVNGSAGDKMIRKLAGELLLIEHPGDHNQAMMEFGALQCVPVNPGCEDCPLRHHCSAYREGMVAELPRKIKKQKIRNRYFTYLVIRNGNDTYLSRRTGNDIWKGMYEFPLIEHENKPDEKEILRIAVEMLMLPDDDMTIEKISPAILHQLTHRKIHARFLHVRVNGVMKDFPSSWEKIRWDEIGVHPVPRLIDRYLEQNSNQPF